MSLQNVGDVDVFFAINVYSGNQDWCLVPPKIFLLKTTLTGFNSSTCFYRDIVNVDVNDIFFSINNIFPKNISNLSKRDNVDVTTPPRWQWFWWWWLSWWQNKIIYIYVDIGIMEFMQFMKYLIVSLFHFRNFTFQLSFWANQALPKRKVRGIV